MGWGLLRRFRRFENRLNSHKNVRGHFNMSGSPATFVYKSRLYPELVGVCPPFTDHLSPGHLSLNLGSVRRIILNTGVHSEKWRHSKSQK